MNKVIGEKERNIFSAVLALAGRGEDHSAMKMQEIAAENDLWILFTMNEMLHELSDMTYNTSVIVDNHGSIIDKYHYMGHFDACALANSHPWGKTVFNRAFRRADGRCGKSAIVIFLKVKNSHKSAAHFSRCKTALNIYIAIFAFLENSRSKIIIHALIYFFGFRKLVTIFKISLGQHEMKSAGHSLR